MTQLVLRLRQGVASWKIVDIIMSELFSDRIEGIKVIDLTYGLGRFYRIARRHIKQLIAVDIQRLDWEVCPDIFYQMDLRVFVKKALDGELNIDSADLVVVDPPWSVEKRGTDKLSSIKNLQHYTIAAPSQSLIWSAAALAKHLQAPLLYRYKELINCNHIIKVIYDVNIFGNKGKVFYGVCKW